MLDIRSYTPPQPFTLFQEQRHLDVMSDMYQRYAMSAYLCHKHCSDFTSILDVGGTTHGFFERFLSTVSPTMEYSIANPGYNGLDGRDLPFSDGQFDVVSCIDTLEHVAPEDRLQVVSEIGRVAKRLMIIAAPIDEVWTRSAESMLYEVSGNEFLREHIEFGLPSLADFSSYSDRLNCSETSLVGNHVIQDWFVCMLNYLKGASPNWWVIRNRFAASELVSSGSQFYRVMLVGVK